MSTEPDPRLELSDWLHAELKEHYALETEPWARERMTRVMAALNAQRPGHDPLIAEILWVPDLCAFTTNGSYIYISRRLLERLPSDDAVAFICAHEIGHHDCHHLRLFSGWTDWMPHIESVGYLAALVRLLEHKAYGPEREAEADMFAMSLALKAGYQGSRVLQALSILENEMLDRGDVNGVFGPENLLDPTDPYADSSAYRLQRWMWTHAHGYLPLRERRARAKAWLVTHAELPSTSLHLTALAAIDQLLSQHEIAYWLFGGWAVDFHVGRVTREHADIDIAIWSHDRERTSMLLRDHAWTHCPEVGEDGYTCYSRDGVRLELAFLARDANGGIYTPLREGRGEWPAKSFGDDVAQLRTVRARVVSRASLIADKSTVRSDAATAAKDRADVESLLQ